MRPSLERGSFIIAHEIGHAILIRRDENTASQFAYDFDPDTCDGESDVPADPTTGHSLTEAEYQAAALSEGWADFVANWAFNDPQYVDEDCEGIHWYASDFDLDGVLDNQDPLGVYDCDSTPMAGLEAWVSSADWLEDAVDTTNDDLACDVSTAHKSTQLDGQRYFWDMHADWNVPVDHLVGILDLANPKDWDPDNNVAGSGGCNTGSVGCTATDDDPIVRLELGADTHPADYAEEHDSCKVNGQDH